MARGGSPASGGDRRSLREQLEDNEVLEVNAQAGMCRVSVRSASDPLNGAVAKSIATQLGTPV